MRDTKSAFKWIVNILKKAKIPYRLTGGFATRLYGSKRELADIDFEIHDKDFQKVLPQIKKYIIWGPKRYFDKNMKTYGLSMRYKGQIIDISGTDTEYLFDKSKKKWKKSRININHYSKIKVFGILVRVVPKKELISYKKKILRRVDKIDIDYLEKKA